jgi:hypothetical protein
MAACTRVGRFWAAGGSGTWATGSVCTAGWVGLRAAGRDSTALASVLCATHICVADRGTAVYDRASTVLLMLR